MFQLLVDCTAKRYHISWRSKTFQHFVEANNGYCRQHVSFRLFMCVEGIFIHMWTYETKTILLFHMTHPHSVKSFLQLLTVFSVYVVQHMFKIVYFIIKCLSGTLSDNKENAAFLL